METKNATIQRETDKTTLILSLDDKDLSIILTDDNPNNVKDVFNQLLKELKKEFFQFELNDDKTDLFHEICFQYLTQLNSELESIHGDLTVSGLLDPEDEDEDDF